MSDETGSVVEGEAHLPTSVTNGNSSISYATNTAVPEGDIPRSPSLVENNGMPHMSSVPSKDANNAPGQGDNIMVKQPEPTSGARGRGRGGSVRIRGKPRASTKARKRKRGGAGEDEDSESEDSEVTAPTNVMTKSGRSVQRPTSFVPPQATASPASAPALKKKRVWRRNPENAVCKLCQRGVSPASNMIVFCDGCNTPYHRWCHHPPIDQSVIEETDKEWYCRQCRRERIAPVAEAYVAHFVAAPGAPYLERQKFFSSLTPGALVTLLTKMSTLHAQLPVFDPEFARKYASEAAATSTGDISQPTQVQQNGVNIKEPDDTNGTIYAVHDDNDDDDNEVNGYGPDEHPAHYVRPGRGLMSTLPPDKDDEEILVDEEGSKDAFQHLYLVDEKAASEGITSNKR